MLPSFFNGIDRKWIKVVERDDHFYKREPKSNLESIGRINVPLFNVHGSHMIRKKYYSFT